MEDEQTYVGSQARKGGSPRPGVRVGEDCEDLNEGT